MPRRFVFMATLVATALVTSEIRAAYVLDDGTGNYNIGPSAFNAQMLWGNYFDAQPGEETIDTVSVSFSGSVPVGAEVRILIFEDPNDDLDPTDAVPLSITIGTTMALAPNQFQTFDVPNTPVSGGFFVAAMMNLLQGQSAARMDPQSQVGRSWLFFDDPGELNVSDLGNAPLFYNMSQTPFNGSWMIRAEGVPEPITLMIVIEAWMIQSLLRNNRA